MNKVISLTTDFGQPNGFVGVMKGVIWGIAPHAHIADITHDIPPQNVRQGAYALWRVVPFFPPGSIHIAVIDPGVGTHRRPIDDPIRLDFSHPKKISQGWEAHITIIDVFGNLTTDLPSTAITNAKEVTFKLGDHVIQGLVKSYGHRDPGELIALVDSEKYIEISVVNGNAAKEIGAQIGDPVEVILYE